jgi:hypothetical protein
MPGSDGLRVLMIMEGLIDQQDGRLAQGCLSVDHVSAMDVVVLCILIEGALSQTELTFQLSGLAGSLNWGRAIPKADPGAAQAPSSYVSPKYVSVSCVYCKYCQYLTVST